MCKKGHNIYRYFIYIKGEDEKGGGRIPESKFNNNDNMK